MALRAAFHATDDRAFDSPKGRPKPRGATVGDATFAAERRPSVKAFGVERGGQFAKYAERRPELLEAARREAKRQEARRRDGARAEETNGEAIPVTPSPEQQRPSVAKRHEARRPHCRSSVRSVQL